VNDGIGCDPRHRAPQAVGVAEIDVTVLVCQRNTRPITFEEAADEAVAASQQKLHPRRA